jgi:hypothetical protein
VKTAEDEKREAIAEKRSEISLQNTAQNFSHTPDKQ